MTRVVTAIVMGFIFVAAIWWLPLSGFKGVLLVITLLGGIEFSRMFFAEKIERKICVAAILAAAIPMIWMTDTPSAIISIFAAMLFILSVLFMRSTTKLEGVAERIGIATFGMMYLGIAFPFWAWIRELPFGNSMVLLAMAPACLCDTFAYAAGKSFGKHKFAPMVSPNKTMEGFFAALAGSMAGAFIIRWLLLPELGAIATAGLAVVIWITSPFGDLVESMLKRSCGVKDSGSMIPGHGGILDRLDALIFTAPFAFIYLKYVIG